MESVQFIINVLVPVTIGAVTWLASTVVSLHRATERCSASNEASTAALSKEIDRLSAELIVNRQGYGELASSLARLSAQTEMVLVLLEQLKQEIRK